ncbi:T9SS C-terminal target domain-containing protein [Flavobacterium sufflavum]|uniref:T9SS C-terminal target domain-containing protein n=1 Tax=Flavobacterium sufflavum TaxID=1921138 RepID=A0A437KXZ0_9FLAO|nr:T9SS C-terminal target domain-containing protein [Flavobacterium sufflavum]RVT77422.1 T9SS C-terminal target domain-containing protein [Flavobacterium sufflavum]
MKIHFLIFCLICNFTYSQISGCTDAMAKNFNPNATINDGSCSYSKTKLKPDFSSIISDSIPETSGLIAFDSLLWTHNDDHDTTLYGMDVSGKIRKKITLSNVINQDWEEITQDENYIYIGDFGNNYQGNRTNLHILKTNKSTIYDQNPKCDTITFVYENQTDFSPQASNATNFDCEAFLVYQDSIYLFTKEWKTQQTTIYSLPNSTGNHVAKVKASLNTEGLVSGATFMPSQKTIVLCGYSKNGKPFLYLLYDFKDSDFLSGNKRKINLKIPFHQIEGIATFDGIHYYLTNEHLQLKPILNVPQKLHEINLSPFLNSFLQNQKPQPKTIN